MSQQLPAPGGPTRPAPRRARHLIDPTAPPRPRDPRAEERLNRVQQWVLSSLAFLTISHLAMGLVVAAMFLPEDDTTGRVGLCVIAGAFGVMALGAALLIHRKSLLTPWLLLGLFPTPVGLWLVL